MAGLASGAVVGQGVGVPTQFSAKNSLLQVTYPAGVLATQKAGDSLSYVTATPGQVQGSSTGDVLLAGICGTDTYDPSTLPADVAANVWASGIFTYAPISNPLSVHKVGQFVLTNVHGSVAYGDFLKPYSTGGWETSTTTNPILNGSIVCLVGNTESGGEITVMANLA